MKRSLNNYWSLWLVAAMLPVLICAVVPILPTHDDWTSLTAPYTGPFFTKRNFFFFGYHWRPFDCWIGYIAGRDPALLFPAFNHLLVALGHTLCAAAVFRMLRELNFRLTTCNIGTLFFYVNPATMATVLAVDSQNQAYSLLWGIVAFMAYLRHRYVLWAALVLTAALCKENGLMWALISPLLAFGFGRTDGTTLRRHTLLALGIMAVYGGAIVLLPRDITIHSDYIPEALTVPKNVVKCVFTSFFTTDYIYLLHQPSRRPLLALLTWLPSLPLFWFVFVRQARHFATRRYLSIFCAMTIAAAPHLLTAYSMMHTYGVLVFVVLMVATAFDGGPGRVGGSRQTPTAADSQPLSASRRLALPLFVLTSLCIDGHLWHESLRSGAVGKQMAVEAIRQTGTPVERAKVVIVKDDFPKLSSFCVIPVDAFGWGLAACYETDYNWPRQVSDTTVNSRQEAVSCARQLLQTKQTDCVWIVDHKRINVIK